MNRRDREIIIMCVIIAICAIVIFFSGYNVGKGKVSKHPDMEQLTFLMEQLHNGTHNPVSRFIKPNMTLESVYELYYLTYPYSKAVLEVELRKICNGG